MQAVVGGGEGGSPSAGEGVTAIEKTRVTPAPGRWWSDPGVQDVRFQPAAARAVRSRPSGTRESRRRMVS